MRSMEMLKSSLLSRLTSTLAVPFILTSLLTTSAVAGEWDEILPSSSQVEKLAEGFKFTEGPAWHPEGFLLFTDIPNDRIVKLDANGKLSDFATPVGRCNGLMCDQQGFIYACQMGDGHVMKMDKNGKVLGYLVDTFENNRMNGPNDLAIDSQGGMYFTDPYYGPEMELPQPMMAVYYIHPDGKTVRIIEDLERPNGVTISPDGKLLYVAEPNRGEVYRYNIQAPGQVTAGHLIYKGDPEIDGNGGPDGMTHDIHGNLYATYNGIVVLNPTGDLIGRIATPEKPANCTFGGPENKTLYITARTGLYKIELGVPGIALPKQGPELAKTTAIESGLPGIPVMLAEEAKTETKTNDVNLGGLTLSIPESWENQPPENRLRLAQFSIPAAEGAEGSAELVVFPPFGGSVDDNITRWINQFDSEGLELKLSQGTTEQGKYHMANIAGLYKKPDGPPFLRKTIDAPDHRMLAVILEIKDQGNYFLKLVGPKKTVDGVVDDFRKSFGADVKSEKEYKIAN